MTPGRTGPARTRPSSLDGVTNPQNDRARALVDGADVLLVDFDGPLARIFPGTTWLEVSADLRRYAVERAGAQLAPVLGDEPDHVQVLRMIGEHAPQVAGDAADVVTRLELEAARTAPLQPGALEFLDEALARSARVFVVTNNDPGVVPAVLDRHVPGLTARLHGVHGRTAGRTDDLKPAPDLLLRALAQVPEPLPAVFLGDSVTDVLAGAAAGVPVVGVAQDAQRRADLLAAGARAVVADLGELLHTPGAGPA